MADYSIAKMVIPNKDTAQIECFFTRKNNDVYCIMPSYNNTLTLKNIKLPAAAKASVPGAKHQCTWKQQGNNVVINLSAIQAGDISSPGIIVIKRWLMHCLK
jgi:alpha-L-fucosidase